jgi:DNA-binding protein YbaB
VTDFESDIRRLTEQVQQQIASFERQREAIAAATGEGTSADGMVTAMVDAGGVLRDLNINPRALRLGSEALRDSILEAVQAAHQQLAETLRELMPTRGTVDIAGLMKKVELPGELRGIMDQLDRRVSDIGYEVDRLRRTTQPPPP